MTDHGTLGAACRLAGPAIRGEGAIPLRAPPGPRPGHVQALTTRENLRAALHPSVEVDFGVRDEG